MRPEVVFACDDLTVGRGGEGTREPRSRRCSRRRRPRCCRSSTGALSAEDEVRAALPEACLTLADATPRALAERVSDDRAGVVLRYACGLAGFLDGDVPLGLMGAFCVARLFSPAIVAGGSKNLANGLARVAAAAGARGLVSSEVTRVEAAGDGLPAAHAPSAA